MIEIADASKILSWLDCAICRATDCIRKNKKIAIIPATIVNNAVRRLFMEPLIIGFVIRVSISLICNPCHELLLLLGLRLPNGVEVYRYKLQLRFQLLIDRTRIIGQLVLILKRFGQELGRFLKDFLLIRKGFN